MLKKDTRFFRSSREQVKHLIIFLWLSLSLHLYFFWGFYATLNHLYNNTEKKNVKPQVLYNVILDTQTESKLQEEEAFISDKNNISRSLQSDKEKEKLYNLININEAKWFGQGGQAEYIPQKEVKSQEKKKEVITKDQGLKKKEQVETDIQQKASEGGGDVAPTLYDPKKKRVINLYNSGAPSLATKSKEYAVYFNSMRDKIEKYHREFFPIYQYYQGLLKNGEVVVEYSLNKNGDILDAKIVSSYGSDTVDRASLNSIIYSKNFGPLPKELQQENEVVIRFHFIYIAR